MPLCSSNQYICHPIPYFFVTVTTILHDEYAKALKKRGIDDPKKVVATPITVGYFGGEDQLEHDDSLLKVVSYLNTGDGNFWAHPIEDLVAIVDLEQGAVTKVEGDGVGPCTNESKSL